jgi:hypothetical protein
MKTTIKNTLEKILNFADKQRKNFLIGATTLGIGAGVANASNGALSTYNYVGDSFDTIAHDLVHRPEGAELLDSKDKKFDSNAIPHIYDSFSKVITRVESHPYPELRYDARGTDSNSVAEYELSLISRTGDTSDWVNKSNYLTFALPLAQSNNYDFGNEPLTLQITQMNGDPNMVGKVYDLRKEISYGNGTGVITLPDLNGTYNSEEVYGKFSVFFDRNLADFNNDGIINLQDFSLLAQEWGKAGNSLADIAIAVGNTGIVLPGTTTPYFDGVVDIADVIEFAENWLLEY